MKKLWSALLIAGLCVAGITSSLYAEEEEEEKNSPETSSSYTQVCFRKTLNPTNTCERPASF